MQPSAAPAPDGAAADHAADPNPLRPQRPPLGAGLYVVATPIGNLRDITLRALDTLAAADMILCEDTRVTGKLMHAYGLSAPLRAYHDHNAAAVRPAVLAALDRGEAVALVSDAGTPLISDPGYRLVTEVLAAGHRVVPVPGASAALAALTTAGLPTDRFLFAGFPPVKTAARRAFLAELAAIPATLVLYETGPRLAASLADMADVLGPRPAAIARELTKLFEEVRRDDLPALAAAYAAAPTPKGEIVVVIGPPAEPAPADPAAMDAALAEAMGRLSLKDAAAEVAARLGARRNVVYARALALRAQSEP